jgi:hypothetical protein
VPSTAAATGSSRRITVKIPHRLTLAVLAVAFAALGVTAWSAVADQSSTTIYACKGSDGTLRVVDQAAAKCPADQTSVSWNTTGPPGPAGPAGPAGAAGPAGVAGSGQMIRFSHSMPMDTAAYDLFMTDGAVYSLACVSVGGIPHTMFRAKPLVAPILGRPLRYYGGVNWTDSSSPWPNRSYQKSGWLMSSRVAEDLTEVSAMNSGGGTEGAATITVDDPNHSTTWIHAQIWTGNRTCSIAGTVFSTKIY